MADKGRHAIFIGYRREDSQDTAGRIYDRLVAAFGEPDVFKDVDNLPIGTDFGDYILGLLPQCRVFLALIGPGWLDARDDGGRRIENPADWVRIEIETALASSGLQVVPVLVNGARMPRADELPESLRPLSRLNAAVVRRDPDFHVDMTRIVAALKKRVAEVTPPTAPSAYYGTEARKKPQLPFFAGLAMVAGLVGAAMFLLPQLSGQHVQSDETAANTAAPSTSAPDSAPPPDPAQLIVGQWGSPKVGCSEPYLYTLDRTATAEIIVITGAQWRATARIDAVRGGWLYVTALSPADLMDRRFAYHVDGETLTVRDGTETLTMQACR